MKVSPGNCCVRFSSKLVLPFSGKGATIGWAPDAMLAGGWPVCMCSRAGGGTGPASRCMEVDALCPEVAFEREQPAYTHEHVTIAALCSPA